MENLHPFWRNKEIYPKTQKLFQFKSSAFGSFPFIFSFKQFFAIINFRNRIIVSFNAEDKDPLIQGVRLGAAA